ncbi:MULTISPECIES: TonB-dependent receptor [unclassified Novosphingobium]|uniref:TonB-dependent receptor n=1 Tax=unclassified Novosphingobium TaxID=2644732 RepID=UPI00135824A9|nr:MULTISPECIES: TonB-dependent receptor [unclassified Novosphingobium]
MNTDFAFRAKALRVVLLCGAVVAASGAAPAFAQDAAPAAAGSLNDEGGNVIVVTSRKREERLQDVPLAITAYSGEEMRAKGISSLADLAAQTPGLAFQDVNGAYAAPVLRGVAQIDQTGPQGNVGIFIDGVYLNNRSALAFDQYDLERIEVVKGPQSALYGRNTFAGAINYVTAAPKPDEFSGHATFTLGNYGRHEAKGSINIPLTKGVALRVFGGFSEFDGTIKNDLSGKYLDGWKDRWSGGAALTGEITDNLTLDLFGVRSETSNDHPALYAMPTSMNNCGSVTTVRGQQLNTFYCGKVPYPTNFQIDDKTGYGLTGSNEIYYGKLNYSGEALDLTAVVSYTTAKFGLLIDTTGNPDAVNTPNFGGLSRQLYTNAATDRSTDWNYDIRASSKAGSAVSWMLGMNYYDSLVSDILTLNFQTLGVEPGTTLPPVFSNRGGTLKTKGHALYGMLGYEITPQFNVQAELRYTIDDQHFVGGGSAAGATGRQTFKYLTPRFSLNWKPADEVLLYATAARGVKTGGFNANAVNTDYFTYGSETNWTYEAGVKTTWLGGALVANAGVFYVDWKDINAQKQLPFSTLAVVGNNGDAEVKGIEAQIAFNPTRTISLTASGALLDPKYKSGVIDGEVSYICGELANSTVTSSNCTSDVGGNQIARTSDKQFALGAAWTVPDIVEGLDGYIRADYSWQAGKYSTGLNLQDQGSISLVNARAGLKFGNYELAIWAKNLLQDKYISRTTVVSSTADSGPVSGVSYTRVYPGERRTIGADLSVRF